MIAAAVFVVFAGWGCLAGSCVDAHNRDISGMSAEELQDLDPVHLRRARHSAVAAFLFNSFEQLSKSGSVDSWCLSNRVWLPILIALAPEEVPGGGVALRKIEQNLKTPRKKPR